MVKKYEELDALSPGLEPGDKVVAEAVRAPDHAFLRPQFVNAWLSGYGQFDIIALGWERQRTRMYQTAGADGEIDDSRTTYSSQLVEYGQMRLSFTAAGAMAATILDALRENDPNEFELAMDRLNLQARNG